MNSREYEVVVIGAGPGGYVAAIRLGQLKKKVLLVDRAKLGGVCLNWGCIPSKALIGVASLYEKIQKASEMGIEVDGLRLDLSKLQEWKQGVVDRLTGGVGQLLKANGVDVLYGDAAFSSPTSIKVQTSEGADEVSFGHAMIATGSRAIELPNLPFDGKKIISSKEALELTEIPESLALVGGGVIGLEIGTFYAKLGTKVSVVELTDQLLPGTDPELVRVVERGLRRRKVAVHLKSKALEYRDKDGGQLALETPDGEKTEPASVVLVAVGGRPNTEELNLPAAGIELDEKSFVKVDQTLRTTNSAVFAIGDVCRAPLLAHKASKEGLVAASIIAGNPDIYDVKAMPAAIFTDPEIATVGLTEEEAKKAGHEVSVGVFPLTASGRALASGSRDGLVKAVADKNTEELLGLHIVSAGASDLIAEGALAIEMGATVEDVALTVHPHPTFSEAVMEACEAALGKAIHMVNK